MTSSTSLLTICSILLGLLVAGQKHGHRQPCSLCGDLIDVTLTARTDEDQDPQFNFSVTLHNTAQRELVYLLQEAAEVDGRFGFTVSYYRGLGFFVESINKRRGNDTGDNSWWHIYSGEPGDGAHCEGVSAYVPDHEESVVFLLTNQNLTMPHCPSS